MSECSDCKGKGIISAGYVDDWDSGEEVPCPKCTVKLLEEAKKKIWDASDYNKMVMSRMIGEGVEEMEKVIERFKECGCG